MDLRVKIDTSGLNRALELAQQYTKRTPSQAVNTAALEIAINAKNYMPYVTVPRIDTELNVAVPLIAKKRGLGLRKGRNFQRQNRVVGDISGRDVPMAVLIVQSRAKAGSNYNLRTGNRYALSKSPFKGVSPSQGRALMAAAITRMINARHSSIKFLMAGWIDVILEMLPYSMNKFRRGSSAGPPLEGKKNYYGADLGSATPAQQGTYNATCIIENLIGYEGRNAASFDRALQLHGAPGLQRAVDNEGAKAMDYYLQKSYLEELEGPFNRAAS